MYYNQHPSNLANNGDRFFFFPFLLGGLGGAALVSAARPRPVYVTQPATYQYPYPNSYGYNYYGGYNYNPYYR